MDGRGAFIIGSIIVMPAAAAVNAGYFEGGPLLAFHPDDVDGIILEIVSGNFSIWLFHFFFATKVSKWRKGGDDYNNNTSVDHTAIVSVLGGCQVLSDYCRQ